MDNKAQLSQVQQLPVNMAGHPTEFEHTDRGQMTDDRAYSMKGIYSGSDQGWGTRRNGRLGQERHEVAEERECQEKMACRVGISLFLRFIR